MKNLNTPFCLSLSSTQKTNSRGVQRFSFGAASFTGAVLVLLLSCGIGVAQTPSPDPLTITPDGKVGIGTSSPLTDLSISQIKEQKDKTADGGQPIGELSFIGFQRPKPSASILAFSPGWDDVGHLIFKTSSGGSGAAERMRITSGGNVGLGTTNPASRLDVFSTTSSYGMLRVNNDSTSAGEASIGFFDTNARSGSSAWVAGVGAWSNTGKFVIGFGGANPGSRFLIQPDGNVGIGTATPANKLSVAGNVDFSGNVGIGTATPTKGKVEIVGSLPATVGRIAYLTQDSVSVLGNPPVGISNGTTTGLSLHADSVIAALRFYAFSDERLKHVKGRSNKAIDLATLMNIEVTDYAYVDSVSKGAGMQKKVTGQQVEKVFPQAVIRTTDVVPDIYQKATTKDGWITLTSNLNKGDRVRLISEKQEGIHEVLEVGEGKFRTAFVAPDGPIFVYGREVNDARSVDYEAISMLNVSATQQIKKEKDEEVKALQAENAALRNQLAEQEKRLAELEAKDKMRDEKLAAIQSLLVSRGQPITRNASLKKLE